jgi:YHS domain-containing protein
MLEDWRMRQERVTVVGDYGPALGHDLTTFERRDGLRVQFTDDLKQRNRVQVEQYAEDERGAKVYYFCTSDLYRAYHLLAMRYAAPKARETLAVEGLETAYEQYLNGYLRPFTGGFHVHETWTRPLERITLGLAHDMLCLLDDMYPLRCVP